jgi:penicillin amidase
MKRSIIRVFAVFAVFFGSGGAVGVAAAPVERETLPVAGLGQPVEIIRDAWGIAHIFARNEADLFFAQGFNVASDRLFQLEIWRRQATGTVAEILGRRELRRDIGARLLKYRGDIREELDFYHPRGGAIVAAFVAGINAYLDRVRANPDLLPLEFEMLGISPGRWTPDVVVSRHNGLFRNVGDEIALARALQVIAPEKLADLVDLHPGHPDLRLPEGLDVGLISSEILGLYRTARSAVAFGPDDIVDASARARSGPAEDLTARPKASPPALWELSGGPAGSNNWAIAGRRTETGRPFLANDPHRALQIPSLRYWVHLVGPGWNVIGGGEPALPGVSIGHNEFGAWGLTIFSADQEDLYVYDLDPEDSGRYRYRGRWEKMETIREDIPVKGEAPYRAALKFTRHGPVVYEDLEHRKAYALRATWLEKGCAPYLASLRMDQARNWREFRAAAFANRTPSENMIWAGRDGDIGWQATGLTPLRKNWAGLIPVPGDGRFEWEGFIPAQELPSLFNPESGFIATANQDNLPSGYPYPVGYLWADPFRFLRIAEVFGAKKMVNLPDMTALQQDVLSIPARRLVALVKDLESKDGRVAVCLDLLKRWDYYLSPESAAAAVYMSWQRNIRDKVAKLFIPQELGISLPGRSLSQDIERLEDPDHHFGREPAEARADRDKLLLDALAETAASLEKIFGPDSTAWRYGDERMHHVRLRHPLSEAVNEGLRATLDLGLFPGAATAIRRTPPATATIKRPGPPSGSSPTWPTGTGRWGRTRPASPEFRARPIIPICLKCGLRDGIFRSIFHGPRSNPPPRKFFFSSRSRNSLRSGYFFSRASTSASASSQFRQGSLPGPRWRER